MEKRLATDEMIGVRIPVKPQIWSVWSWRLVSLQN